MRVNNSQYKTWWECPLKWYEEFVVQHQGPKPWYEYGARFHQLLHTHYGGPAYPPHADEQLEAEAQAMMAAYRAHYPQEPFEVLACEQTFEIPIPGTNHVYYGTFDAIVRSTAGNQKLQLFETKTESKGSRRNDPKAWAARSQVSLYLWAAEQLYGEKVDNIILNVCTRASKKGNVGPSFRRDTLERSSEQTTRAIFDLIYVADQMDAMTTGNSPIPSNRNNCVSENGWACEFFDLHNIGQSPELLTQLVPTMDRGGL